jgi:hypothetical protein
LLTLLAGVGGEKLNVDPVVALGGVAARLRDLLDASPGLGGDEPVEGDGASFT